MPNYPTTRKCLHGHAQGKASSEYNSWRGMIQRCSKPRDVSYKNYGAKGVTFDPAWKDFTQFIKDMGPKPDPSYWLDRKNNSKGYSKENCQWSTPQQQMHNFSRNRWITWDGKTQLAADWAREFGINRGLVTYYIKRWASVEAGMARLAKKHGKI